MVFCLHGVPALVFAPQVTPFAAAKQVGLSANTLYVALKKERAKQGLESCPCCGTLVPGEKINRDVLKAT